MCRGGGGGGENDVWAVIQKEIITFKDCMQSLIDESMVSVNTFTYERTMRNWEVSVSKLNLSSLCSGIHLPLQKAIICNQR